MRKIDSVDFVILKMLSFKKDLGLRVELTSINYT
jgi:hypothetical protein